MYLCENIRGWTTTAPHSSQICQSLLSGASVSPFPSLSFPFSPSLLPSSPLAVHISVCSQELAGLCQTEIR